MVTNFETSGVEPSGLGGSPSAGGSTGAPSTCSYAYLGPQGTYSHAATRTLVASRHDATENLELVECATLSEIFDLVDRGRATYGVVPIENALEGSVNETLDAFAFTSNAKIQAEIVVDIHHNLIAQPGTKMNEISTVVSHPQALGQCRRWLLSNLPGAQKVPANSTADAVRTALEQPGTAAIGNALAAEMFGGEIIAERIEDRFGNQTRFVLIAPDILPKPKTTAGYKTSLALFMKEDRPGTLLMILEEFAYAGINMTKIQSRPTKKALGDYMFWIDLMGHTEDLDVKTALDCLRLKLREVKVIGSYPAAVELGGLA